VEELVSQQSTTEVEPQAPVAESRTEPAAAPAAKEPAATEAEEEVPAEAGLVDITSIIGPDRDCCPVELVGEDLSRVVHVDW
jgi:hypothetical protein